MKQLPVLRGQDTLAPFWELLNDKVVFCGGFVRYMVSPLPTKFVKPFGDIDLYPLSAEKEVEAFETIEKAFKPSKESVIISPMARSIKLFSDSIKLQLIKHQEDSPVVTSGGVESIISAFDFSVTQAGLIDRSTALVSDEFVEDEIAGRLTIKRIHCPISILRRITKYVNKGYNISHTELYKIFIDWDNRSNDYKAELNELINNLYQSGGDFHGDDMDREDSDRLKHLLYID